MWTIKSEHCTCTSNSTANEGSNSTYTRQLSIMNARDKCIVSFVKCSIEEKKKSVKWSNNSYINCLRNVCMIQ